MKKQQQVVEKLVKMSRNDDYTTGNLLDYLYHQSYHKPICIDSSSNTNPSAHQKMNFTGKLEEDDNATMLFKWNIEKILDLFAEGSSKFVTRKWKIVNDQWNANYDVGNEIICKTEVLKSNLWDYNDA